jgi:hypothetical protein
MPLQEVDGQRFQRKGSAMKQSDIMFLKQIEIYTSENPEVAAYINDYVASGLRKALSEAKGRAADMEVALAVAIEPSKKSDGIVLSMLKKWQGKTSLIWDSVIERLEGKSNDTKN